MTNSDINKVNTELETIFLTDNDLLGFDKMFDDFWPYLVEDYLAEEDVDNDNDF